MRTQDVVAALATQLGIAESLHQMADRYLSADDPGMDTTDTTGGTRDRLRGIAYLDQADAIEDTIWAIAQSLNLTFQVSETHQ